MSARRRKRQNITPTSCHQRAPEPHKTQPPPPRLPAFSKGHNLHYSVPTIDINNLFYFLTDALIKMQSRIINLFICEIVYYTSYLVSAKRTLYLFFAAVFFQSHIFSAFPPFCIPRGVVHFSFPLVLKCCVCEQQISNVFLKLNLSIIGEEHPWSICLEQVVANYCSTLWCSTVPWHEPSRGPSEIHQKKLKGAMLYK